MNTARATRLLSAAMAPSNRNVPEFSKETLPIYFQLLRNAKQRENLKINARIITILSATKQLPTNIQRRIIKNLVNSGNLPRARVLKGPPVRTRTQTQTQTRVAPTKKSRKWVWLWNLKKRRTIHPV